MKKVSARRSKSTEQAEPSVQSRLEEIFASLKSPGSFAAGGPLPSSFALPLIEVHGLQELITFPLQPSAAQQLISVASKSPFGRGERTLFDEKVRKSWQLDPSKFKINNPQWERMLKTMLWDQVMPGLGILHQKVSCSLYKMLIYEKGGCFAPHRDTEKEDGMFGTLVIQLPCSYKGGEMIVSHEEKQQKFNFEATNLNSYFTCFYADCQHEVKEITEGYRICLVYNLIYTGEGEAPTAYKAIHQTLAKTMDLWLNTKGNPKLLVYVLEHQYTQAGLSYKNLKGHDKLVVDVLKETCGSGILSIHLALLNSTVAYGEHSPFSLMNLSTLDGHIQETRSKELNSNVVFPIQRFYGFLPYREGMEDTGNEGAVFTRWYRTAVLVFWPCKAAHHSWLKISNSFACKMLESKFIASQQSSEKTEELRVAANELMGHVDHVLLGKIIVHLEAPDMLNSYFQSENYKSIKNAQDLAEVLRGFDKKFGEEVLKPYLGPLLAFQTKFSLTRSYNQRVISRIIDIFESDETWLGKTVLDTIIDKATDWFNTATYLRDDWEEEAKVLGLMYRKQNFGALKQTSQKIIHLVESERKDVGCLFQLIENLMKNLPAVALADEGLQLRPLLDNSIKEIQSQLDQHGNSSLSDDRYYVGNAKWSRSELLQKLDAFRDVLKNPAGAQEERKQKAQVEEMEEDSDNYSEDETLE